MSECHEQVRADGLRDSQGRFVKGNAGGPGNPFARQVAALRQTLLGSITPEDIAAIGGKLVESRASGNVQAAKLVLAYGVGKPRAAVDPDQLDSHEWELMKKGAAMTEETPRVVKSLAPAMAVNLGRALQPVLAETIRPTLLETLLAERNLPPWRAASVIRDACADLPQEADWLIDDLLAAPIANGESESGEATDSLALPGSAVASPNERRKSADFL